MKTAIIIHGMPSEKEYYKDENPSPSNAHWLPWIQKELIKKNILAQTPEMPVPYNPEYNAWKNIFERFLLNEETILIGHSCGGGFLVRYLSENDVKVGKVIFIAPWMDVEESLNTGMFDFNVDDNLVSKTKGITIFISNDDEKPMQDTVSQLRNVKDIKIIEFKDKGHFCYEDMGTDEFPQLLIEAFQ